LIRAQRDDLSSDAAEFLPSIAFDDRDQERMLELADQSEAGILTHEEQAEFDSYLHIGNFLAVMQSKARLAPRKSHKNLSTREPGMLSGRSVDAPKTDVSTAT
jgi:hypothetical protein